MQIILVNIPTQAYSFKIKRIPSSLNIFNLPIPYSQPLLSRGHQTITLTIINHCCYRFDGLWKVKHKYIVLCLNVFAKLHNERGISLHPVILANCGTCSHIFWPYQSTEWFVISPFQVVCRA